MFVAGDIIQTILRTFFLGHPVDYFLAWEISEYIILFIIEDPVY